MIGKCQHERRRESREEEEHLPPRGGKTAAKNSGRRYPTALRLRAVKLHLEEGFAVDLVAEELGVSKQSVRGWLRRYHHQGEAGLESRPTRVAATKLPDAVHHKIVELKKEEPTRGVKKISQLLRRIFFLRASTETVRQTLKHEGLI